MGSFKQMIIMLVCVERTGWSSPSCPKLFHFLCNPASLLGSFHLHTLAYDMKEAWWHHGSLSALISPDTCRERPCFQPVSLQLFEYNKAQALPASRTHYHKTFPNKAWGKKTKTWFFFIFFLSRIVGGIHLSSGFEPSDSIFPVFMSYSAFLFSCCPIHSPSIPNIRAKKDYFPLWNLRFFFIPGHKTEYTGGWGGGRGLATQKRMQ